MSLAFYYEDGSFVVRSFDAFRESYFDRIRECYEELDGKGPEDYIAEISSAMEKSEDYSAVIAGNIFLILWYDPCPDRRAGRSQTGG